MYHDQLLTPFKTLFKFNAINVTLGLKYLRIFSRSWSSDLFNKKRKANPISLIKCIKFLDKFEK